MTSAQHTHTAWDQTSKDGTGWILVICMLASDVAICMQRVRLRCSSMFAFCAARVSKQRRRQSSVTWRVGVNSGTIVRQSAAILLHYAIGRLGAFPLTIMVFGAQNFVADMNLVVL